MSRAYKALQAGQLVRSIAGRDHGKYYMVYKVRGSEVLLVDGRKRLPENAKVKNPCHLQASKQVSAVFAEKQSRVTPEDIRAALAELLRNNSDEEAETQYV